MSKAEWGLKRRCANCEARFYDMQRKPIRCPKCDTVFVAAAVSAASSRGPRSRALRPYVPATHGTVEAEPDRGDWAPDSKADAAGQAEEPEEADADVADDEDGLEPGDEPGDAEDDAKTER
jgi:uncharacterized protein (TIGR02300 family)